MYYQNISNIKYGHEVVWADANDTTLKLPYGSVSKNKVLKSREYEVISNDLSHGKTEQVIAKTNSAIANLIANKDTIKGIAIGFGKNTRYDDVIKVIDLCDRYENDKIVHLIDQDKCLIYYSSMKEFKGVAKIKNLSYIFICGGSLYVKASESLTTVIVRFIKELKLSTEILACILISWLILLICSIWQIKGHSSKYIAKPYKLLRY
ncbi:hypothetical protein GCM10023149_06690 [Mucilaginibacter gynuensis]|uniref:Uncharacterized protein n=1 Tax=Mucilaginibacter gynuensis TaxID=1302236 RepID=A0ABP8FV31_9SPHI